VSIPVGSVLLVSFRSLCFAQRVILTHTYRVTEDAGTAPPYVRSQQIAGAIAANPAGLFFRYVQCMPPDVHIKEIRCQVIHPVRYQYGTVGMDTPGAFASVARTANNAVAVTLQTGVAGRGEIANKHIGPLPNDAFGEGAPTAGYSDKLNDLGNQFVVEISEVIAGSMFKASPVIFHRATGQNSPAVIWVVSDRVGTMRRRTLRVGE